MSPAPGQMAPASLRSRIRRWFAVHPGWHRPADLYDDLPDQDRQAIRNECKRMSDPGFRGGDALIRHRPAHLPAKGPGTVYAAPGTPPPTD